MLKISIEGDFCFSKDIKLTNRFEQPFVGIIFWGARYHDTPRDLSNKHLILIESCIALYSRR